MGANSGGSSIEVRLGAPDGKLIGTMDVDSTGGWQTWDTQKCSIDTINGINNVFFLFKGGSGYLFNVNLWKINCIYNEDILMGDCNLDGKVSIADGVMLQKWLLGSDNELIS